MLLSAVFDTFLAKRPLCVMARGVLEHLLEPGHVDRLFADAALGRMTAQEMATWLRTAAADADLRRYRKHHRGPKKPPPKKSRYKNGGHVSTEKLLRQRTRSG